ncbi:MAG: accessory gene regulator ArgB-like protein [Chitinophagales bacterium]
MDAAKILAHKLTNYFGWPAERYDVAVFGLTYLLLYLSDVAGVILAGWLAGAFVCTLAAALTSAVFRTFTGGAHFSRAWLCWLFSYAVLGLFGAFSRNMADPAGPLIIAIFLVIAAGTAAAAIHTLAPVDSPAKRIAPAHAAKLRKGAWFALLVWVLTAACLVWRGHLAVAVAAGLGLTWQTFTLTRGGAWFYRCIDRMFIPGPRARTKGGELE